MGPFGIDEPLNGPPRAVAGHQAEPAPGTMYSAEGVNTGLAADPRYVSHYPMTARCRHCELVIRLGRMLAIGSEGEWQHTGRRWGEA